MRLTIRKKLLLILGAVAALSAGVAAYLGYSSARTAIETQTYSQLTVVRETKAREVEDYFQTIIDQTVTFSRSRMVIDAALEFRRAFENVEQELNLEPSQMDAADLRLRMYYAREFLPRLANDQNHADAVSSFWPSSRGTRTLQDIYLASSPFDTGSKDELDDPRDGTSYARTHGLYHPIIREFLDRFGYYDIFIVDPETGHIVYSVFKEVDFGTSLLSGPYRETNLARAFEAARDSDATDFVHLVDFEPYGPSYDAHASFIASPIFDGEEKVGVLIFQMPVDRISEIMTSGRRWREVGLGESGESYIVGDDLRLRSQSRFFIEDRDEYVETMRAVGTSPSTLDEIDRLDTTVGIQKVESEGVLAALDGRSGTMLFDDYRGVPVLSSFRPLDIRGVDWVLMSEIDEAEAFAPIRELRDRVLFFMVLLLVAISGFAWFFSGTLTKPLSELKDNAAELAEGNLSIAIDTSGVDEIGDLSRSLDAMRKSLEELVSRQERAIDALSVPMIPLHDDVIAMPLVGELDTYRLEKVRSDLLEGIHRSGARVALLDLTGVPTLDADGAIGIEGAVKAARLVGAHVIITGMRADVARSMAELDLSFEGIAIEATIQGGIARAMRQIDSPRKGGQPDTGSN